MGFSLAPVLNWAQYTDCCGRRQGDAADRNHMYACPIAAKNPGRNVPFRADRSLTAGFCERSYAQAPDLQDRAGSLSTRNFGSAQDRELKGSVFRLFLHREKGSKCIIDSVGHAPGAFHIPILLARSEHRHFFLVGEVVDGHDCFA